MEEHKIIELINLVRSINKDEFHVDVTSDYSYESLKKEILYIKEKVHNDHNKSELILDHITQIATGDLTKTIEVEGDNSIIDAIAMGINVFTEELRESTISVDEYKDTLNALPYVIWSSNIDFSKVLYVNESIKYIFGVTSEEILSNKNLWVDLIHPDDRGYVETKFDEFFESGHFDVKYRLIKPTGEEVWILDQAKFLLNNDGEKYRIVGICKDITEQEISNQKLQDSTNKLLHAHRVANMGHWELNISDMSAIWTEGMYDIFEINPEIHGRELFDLINKIIQPQFVNHVNENIKRSIYSNQKVDFIYQIKTLKTNRIKYLHSFAEPVVDSLGNVISVNGLTQDITEKSLQENQVKEAITSLEEAQALSKIGSWEWNLITHDLVWSKQHYEIFELPIETPKEILFQAYRDKIHPEDLITLDSIIKNSTKTGEGFEYIHRAIMDDGRMKYVRGLGHIIKNESSEIISFQGTAQDITTQFLQEKKLNQTLNSLNAILDATEYSIISTNLEGVITLFNKGAEKMLGYNADELVGIKTPEIIHLSSEVENKAKELTETLGVEILPGIDVFHYIPREFKKTYTDQWTYIAKDGRHIPVSLTINTVRDENGELKGYLGVSKDMSVENAKNQEVIAVKTELQNFFDLTSDFLAIVSGDGLFEQVNHTFEQKLGYNKEELLGQSVLFIAHPNDIDDIISDFESIDKNQEISLIERELRYVSKNKDVYWVSLKIVIDQKLNKHYVSGRDITQQREKDIQLQKALNSVKEYKHALDQIAIVSTSDLHGNILTANDKFMDISGYSLEELVGKNHSIVNSGYHDKKVFEDLWKTISSGKIWRGEICNKKKNGENYWVDSLIVPFLDENHKPLWYFSIRYDITEKKEQEKLVSLNEELQKEKELAEQKTRLKERFLANMSHEIRTPMNSILGLSNLMEKVGTLNPKQMDYIKTIKLNSKNLLNIINDILDLSKIEEGKLELENATIDIRELVVNTVKTLTLTAHKKKIDLLSEIDVQIPQTVFGDSTRLNQVILNLTNNAIKFTDNGSVTIKVRSLNKTENEITIQFEIVDTGIGIESNKVDKIFEPFTQEKSSTTRLYGGTGLGLTISNQIIHAFGSEIKVKSEIGVGSVFYFDIVFNYQEDSKTIEFETHEQEFVNLPVLKGAYSILLVEDNPFNQMVAEDTLKDWYGEFKIDIAENGLIALNYLKENQYDLVLMDIQMPELDGHHTTVKARKELNVEIPIIAMTAQATPAEIQACMISGMNDYISKPFDENKLFATITKWLLKSN